MTSRSEIHSWLRAGKARGATHVLVFCDSFDWSDSPVYVMPGEDPQVVAREYPKKWGDAYRLMECYALHLDFNAQLDEFRAHHYESAT